MANVLLGAWQSLLWRLSGNHTFKVGAVFDGRQFEELQSATGLFEKTLPIDSRFDGDLRFREVVANVTAAVSKATDWQEHFAPGDGFENEPPVGFEFIEQSGAQKLGDLTWTVLRCNSSTEHFKLKLVAVRRDGGLTLEFHHDGSRLERDTVERISAYFLKLLSAGLENPEMLVSRLPLLSDTERRQILVDWNQTTADYPKDRCIHELFEAQTERDPDRLALRFEDRQLSYRELNQRANQLAHYLRKLGVGPNSLVGMCVDRSADMIVALLAILKAGAGYVPLHPENPTPRLAQQMTGAVALITETKFLEQLPQFGGTKLFIDRDQRLWADQPSQNLAVPISTESAAYVIYTSGSTGIPKGVTVRHRNLVNYSHFITQRLELASHPEGLQFGTVSTIGADLGNTCIFPSLISGGCLNVISYETSTDAMRLAEYTRQHPIDVLKIVPSHLQALLYSDEARHLLPWKYLVLGGEMLSSALIEQIKGLGGECEILNHYGPTETTVGSLTLRLKEFDWKSTSAASIPIGRPIANTHVYILDKHLEPVAIGVVGELYISGDGVSAGYLNQPERTAEQFVPNPFVSDTSAKMYRTGDLARYLADGNVEFLGRGDDQIKIRGFRIELEEIEFVLSKRTGVKQSIVLAKEDSRGDKQLIAYVASDNDRAGSSDDLRDFLREQLPEYMVPSAIVVLSKLPLTANGKVDRQALPAPEAVQKKVFIGPRTATEAMVASVWAEVLGRDQVSADDNFFDLGGHSLLAVRALGELEKVVGRRIPVASLFRGATVESLAKMLSEASEAEPEPLVLKLRAGDGARPLFMVASPGVRAIGYALLARHIDPDQTMYKLQAQEPVVLGRPFLPAELETLTTQYVAAIRAVQPQGPYYIAAMCSGCMIAEQMILQLEAQGEEVALFVTFDTWVLQHVHRRWRWRVFAYQQWLRSLRRSNFSENIYRLRRAVLNRIRVWNGKRKKTPLWPEAYWPKNFTPSRFHARVLLFKREKQPYYYINDPLLGWGTRTVGGVDVHTMATDRHRILREPFVQIIGARLSAYLRAPMKPTEPIVEGQIIVTTAGATAASAST